ncbi:hypothetical protein AOCH_002337 [Aspergillus ochraceoroseus]|uniref:Sensor histidine kinase/response regulator n=2 Tax=Aspergillus ochraceoroseus TaxID=138278 RepID=A0A0F8XIV2_9EURO|nr:hypothetical protein AOCH_002337 [Aspergillus ochraceoroseus]
MAPELARIYKFRALDSDSGRRNPDQQQSSTSPAADPVLAALAQLGLYRLGCSQAFVTILEDNEPYVIAEATTTNSATRSTAEEPSLVGVESLGPDESEKGLEDTKDTSRVIRDISVTEESVKSHPLILRRPRARLYAEVPLRGSTGEMIGSYGVLDDAPRLSWGPRELDDLRDVAGLVVAHLENVWAVEYHRHSQRQLDALVTFVGGQSDFQETERKPRKKSSGASNSMSSRPSDVPSIEHLPVSSIAPGEILPIRTKPHHPETTANSLNEHQLQLSPREKHQQHVRRCSEETNNIVLVTETGSPRRTSWIFSRASTLLQEYMDIDGVMFFDAARNNSRSSSNASASDWDINSHDADSGISHRSFSQSSHGHWSDKLCEPLGVAVSEKSSLNGPGHSRSALTEGLLHDMFNIFPHGEVFHSIQSAKEGHPLHQSVAHRLSHCYPDATSIVFLPLWSWDKSRWLAAAVVWTCEEQWAFGAEDLYYLRAFGDSIVSAFSQLDRSATEKSKSDLLASVSHELRSPLHGMLASSELLQTTALEPAQKDMVTMVETCGLTLLDTMNHLLDFAKINNLTRVHKKGGSHEADMEDLTSEFDLDTLVEDVTDSLYAGHRSLVNASKMAGRYLPVGTGVGHRGGGGTEPEEPKNMGDLSVIVRIEERESWRIQSISGAWGRIIMNLLGNAFKFTRSGFIEISLAQKEERHNGFKSVFAHLTITDTGCGISRDFLDNKLFTPFSQEDILTEGVGLGLSIVQQLVAYVDGHVDLKSEVGVGTQVDVYIPVGFAEPEPRHPRFFDAMNRPGCRIMKRVCLVGLTPYADLREAPRGLLSTDAKRKLSIRGAISNILLSQPGWMLSFADSLNKASGDIVVLEESTLKKIAEKGPIKTGFRSVIVLGEHGVSIPGDFTIEGADVIYIPQPLGPRKVIQALQRFTESQQPHCSSGEESPIFGPMPGFPMRGRSLSEAFAMAKGSESPPVVRENVSEFSPPLPQGSAQRDIHVLIVDDNDINLKILATFMRKIGCSYETASNGLVALEKYRNSFRKFDYVLMDISMPIMDGIVASSRIREYEEEKSLPRSAIMAVTGVASSEMQQQAFAAGIDDYLVKPLSLHDLKRIMNIP